MNHRTWRLRAAQVGVLACAATAAYAGQARANFTAPYTNPCSGGALIGKGTGFGNRQAQIAVGQFASGNAPESCVGFAFPVTQVPTSSADAVKLFSGPVAGRDADARVVRTGGGPGTVERALIDAGRLLTGRDDAKVRTIPVTSTSVALLVNAPNGCTFPEGALDGTGRLQLSNAGIEAAFAGDPAKDTWGELVPGITGDGCAALPVKRVVHDEAADTTTIVKRFLATVDASRGWNALSGQLLNTAWPHGSSVIRAAGNANTELAETGTLTATDGSIGYADLFTARSAGYAQTGATADDRYWLNVTNAGGESVEPSLFPADLNIGGANCDGVTYANIPSGSDPTAKSWNAVNSAATPSGYPLCGLVYTLAWDDAADAYGNTAAEQAKQRTARDLLGWELGDTGQAFAQPSDAASLPAEILAIARAGQQAVGWSK